MCSFDRKIWILGPKVMFMFRNRNFCQMGIWPVCPGLQISYLDHPEKNSIFRAMGHFSGLTPLFGRFGPFPLRCNKYPYFWTAVNETCWNRPGHRNMTHNDNGPDLGRNHGETAVFTFGRKVFFWPKICFPPQKTQNFQEDWYFGKGYFFVCTIFPGRVRKWLELRSKARLIIIDYHCIDFHY